MSRLKALPAALPALQAKPATLHQFPDLPRELRNRIVSLDLRFKTLVNDHSADMPTSSGRMQSLKSALSGSFTVHTPSSIHPSASGQLEIKVATLQYYTHRRRRLKKV